MVLELNVTIDGGTRESLCAGAKDVVAAIMPSWDKSKFLYKVYTDGISNQLVGVWPEGESKDLQLLVRVYGNKTELFIDRSAEKKNIQFLYSRGCGPTLWACFLNGLCYSYTVGIPLSTSTMLREEISTATLTHMAELHSIELEELSEEPVLFPKAASFLNLLPDFNRENTFSRIVNEGYSKEYLRGELAEIETVVKSLACPIVLCHNDLLLANIIWNEKDKKVRFIDFEYAAPNYQPYDIANHFCEYAGVDDVDYSRYPTLEYQMQWISKYLGALKRPSARSLEWWIGAVQVLALASHLFWASWALLQGHFSSLDFDFIAYSLCRLGEYRRHKAAFIEAGKNASQELREA